MINKPIFFIKEFEFQIALEKAFFQGPESKTILFGDIKKEKI